MLRFLLLLLLLLLLIPLIGFTQTLSELEQRRQRIRDEIANTNRMLERAQREHRHSIAQLEILKGKIDLQKVLLAAIDQQMRALERDITSKSDTIHQLQTNLQQLKENYASLIRFAWRDRSRMQIIIFIFAANDFNQAYRRFRFYQQLIRFRQEQARQILRTQELIEGQVSELRLRHSKQAALRIDQRNEAQNLASEQRRFTRAATQLQQQQQQLNRELQQRRQAMEAINRAIEELIAEEARRAASARRDPVRDARHLRASEGFAGNKGRLPWPTARGVVVGHFGEHNHPVIRGVKVRNNGIDISAEANSTVSAIFEGEVARIVSIPGANSTIILRHGDFLTVYSNLVNIQVRVGEAVSANQALGHVFTDAQTGRTVLNLQIWRENQMLNPREWILP